MGHNTFKKRPKKEIKGYKMRKGGPRKKKMGIKHDTLAPTGRKKACKTTVGHGKSSSMGWK